MESTERARLHWETAVIGEWVPLTDKDLAPTCGSCSYCCWAYGVPDVPCPDGHGGMRLEVYHKQAMEACPYDLQGRCAIHSHARYPDRCKVLDCAYLRCERGILMVNTRGITMAFRIHRPYLFQDLVEKLCSVKGTLLPAVPNYIRVERARELIQDTLCIPTAEHGIWRLQMLKD